MRLPTMSSHRQNMMKWHTYVISEDENVLNQLKTKITKALADAET